MKIKSSSSLLLFLKLICSYSHASLLIQCYGEHDAQCHGIIVKVALIRHLLQFNRYHSIAAIPIPMQLSNICTISNVLHAWLSKLSRCTA